jgi:exonuclease VII small subunit
VGLVSDELTALIADLEKEVLPLERALRLREAEEGQRLKAEEMRLAAAQARVRTAEATLKAEAAELAVLDARRAELRRITEGWRGQLWSLGYGTLVTAAALSAITAFPVIGKWFPGTAALWVVGGQAVAFGLLWLFIPRKA